MQALRKFAGAILGEETRKLLEYKQLVNHPKYKEALQHTFGNEISQLAQGLPNMVQGTDTIFLSTNTNYQQTGGKTSHKDESHVIITNEK